MKRPRQSLTVIAEPVPKARPRIGKNNNVYTPRESRDYETLIAWEAKKLPRYVGPVALNITFYITPGRRADLDNLAKSVMDGLQQGGALEDDVQVKELHVTVMQETKQPRMTVSIVALNEVRQLDPEI